jgi:ring-1,2-phenylacetyl-CoA epoxidase subunit PaaC
VRIRHSTEWLYRLGDGTAESHQKTEDAVEELWMYTGDMFDTDQNYRLLQENNIVPDMNKIKELWNLKVKTVFETATISVPELGYMQSGSLKGSHTEHLGFLLAEMQHLQRSYPNSNW